MRLSMKEEQKKTVRQIRRKRALITSVVIVVCAGVVMLGLSLYGKYRMRKIPALSFQEALAYTTKENDDAVITVGIIKGGQISYTVYGANGKELPQALHTYEIGSLTKTFTAAMISKAVREERIDIRETIDRYLPLPEGNAYPTIEELLTHTSGYQSEYFEIPMISNFFTGRNDFYGITREMLLRKAGELNLPEEEYPFSYSNYGYAVLGLVLEAVYERDYTTLMNAFLQEELHLANTRISNQNGDLGKYWDWNSNDAYLSAGAITSDISDMLSYAQMLLDQYAYFADCQKSLKEIHASTEQNKMIGIRLDAIGMAWIIDRENGIIWHNGGTGDYNSYLGFIPETGAAVVVLSNLSPNYRIPATVLGIKALTELNN